MPSNRADITIVGAGLIGSALALWLAKNTDYKISVIERNSLMTEPLNSNERVLALGALATDFLNELGVFTELGEHHCHAYQKMLVWDDNSDGELYFDAKHAGLDGLGHMVDGQMCNYQLQQLLSLSRVDCHFGINARELELNQDDAAIVADSGRYQAKLIVAADGSRSWVRQQAKIFANHRSYHQQGIVTKIRTEKRHQNCAWQGFLATGPVAILPLSNNQSSIVWSCDNVFAKHLLGLSDDEFGKALSDALQGRLGAVTILAKRQAFPLSSLKAERYFKRNLVLIGDSAHAIHPLAGQGANLGFKDALALGNLLQASDVSDLGSPKLLSQYQSRRQADNDQIDALMSALHQAYKIDLPAWMLARGLGMNLLNNSNLLRKMLARQAMGL